MSIDFPCSSCGKVLSVKSDLAGKKGRCPACQTVNSIPDGTDPASPTTTVSPLMPPISARSGPTRSNVWGFPVPANSDEDEPKPFYEATIRRVHVINVDMPFRDMCWFIFKWTFAAGPTLILLAIIAWVTQFLFYAMGILFSGR